MEFRIAGRRLAGVAAGLAVAVAVAGAVAGAAAEDGPLRPPAGGSGGNLALVAAVETALFDRLYLRPFDVGVGALDGRVVLVGRVPTIFARDEAEELAASVPGVLGVASWLIVAPRESPYLTGGLEAPPPPPSRPPVAPVMEPGRGVVPPAGRPGEIQRWELGG